MAGVKYVFSLFLVVLVLVVCVLFLTYISHLPLIHNQTCHKELQSRNCVICRVEFISERRDGKWTVSGWSPRIQSSEQPQQHRSSNRIQDFLMGLSATFMVLHSWILNEPFFYCSRITGVRLSRLNLLMNLCVFYPRTFSFFSHRVVRIYDTAFFYILTHAAQDHLPVCSNTTNKVLFCYLFTPTC